MGSPEVSRSTKTRRKKSSSIEFIERYLRAETKPRFTALLVGQVDAFNRISTTFGSDRAGEFFDEYTGNLRALLPEGSVVVRLSDRRFAALLRIDAMGALIDTAVEITEGKAPKLIVGEDALLVDVTVGVAVYPTHATTGDNLFRRAEFALNEARRKEMMFEVYQNDATQQQASLWKFASDLQKAIDDRELDVYLQPKVRIDDGSAAGVEALVRWRQSSGQLILPSEFIPLAEQSGSIVPMTWLIFDKIRDTVGNWEIELDDFTMAVNVSAQVIEHAEFLDRVLALRDSLDRKRVHLLLELTEESLVDDFKKIRKKIDRMRDLGVGLAIDDFGKGYSSLTYLKDIPASEIKIDKKFVENIAIDEKDWHIVKATMDLAKAFGMRVVAEGVDNDQSMRVLGELGCELAQGFYISRPIRSDLLEDWLQSKLSMSRRMPRPSAGLKMAESS